MKIQYKYIITALAKTYETKPALYVHTLGKHLQLICTLPQPRGLQDGRFERVYCKVLVNERALEVEVKVNKYVIITRCSCVVFGIICGPAAVEGVCSI